MKELLLSPITAEKLEIKGKRAYVFGKIGMLCGVFAIALFIFVGSISIATGADFFAPFLFILGVGYEFAYLFVVATYLGLLAGILGIGAYLYGMIIFALGRIACNTKKD